MMTLPDVLSTTRFVVDHARDVTIDPRAVQSVADRIAAGPQEPAAYDCDRHLCGTDPAVANFVLVLDTLNFSFWPDPGETRWRVAYRGEAVNGYWALVAALRRALDEGVPLLDAAYLADMSEVALAHLLRGEGVIPLLAERAAALREVGAGLRDRSAGQCVNMIERAGRNAPRLTSLLAAEFSSFDDVASYAGRPVQLYKRAQICCSDLYGASGGAGWGALSDLDRLTAFADYKVPQVLLQLGVLVYSEALARAVDERVLLPRGSPAEVEIRAATIWAVEELRRALVGRGVALRAFEIDWHLWNLGQDLPPDTKPYHLTRTIYY
jgi:hypothetical protein